MEKCIHINGNNSDNRRKNVISARGYKHNGKTFLNGYIAIYLPEHPRAFPNNGCVYEHILVAEKVLGRNLNNEECVHHINHNRTDNRKENLMVFKTSNDHIRFHGGGIPIKNEDGTYSTKSKFEYNFCYNNRTREDINNNVQDMGSIVIKNKDLCPICKKNLKSTSAKKCLSCYRKEIAINIPTKDELEQYIYNTPFTKIGQIYGVSDNSVRKWCKKYGLPFRKKDLIK